MLNRGYRDIARALLYGAITNAIYRSINILTKLAGHYGHSIADSVQSDDRIERAINDLTDGIIDCLDKFS